VLGGSFKRKPAPPSSDILGPSPNAETNLAIADIALRGSSMLARRAAERVLLGQRYAPRKARAILKGRSFTEGLLHRTLARIALGSMPGAILVGGGLIAKTLADRSKGRIARAEGQIGLEEKAADGADEVSKDGDT